jgi:hypothetical protein
MSARQQFNADELRYMRLVIIDEVRISLEDGIAEDDPWIETLISAQAKLDALTGHTPQPDRAIDLLDEAA